MRKWKKARKKPVVIKFREVEPNMANGVQEQIVTREGILYAGIHTDFIIKGVEGEIYPIHKEIFKKTYDVIEK